MPKTVILIPRVPEENKERLHHVVDRLMSDEFNLKSGLVTSSVDEKSFYSFTYIGGRLARLNNKSSFFNSYALLESSDDSNALLTSELESNFQRHDNIFIVGSASRLKSFANYAHLFVTEKGHDHDLHEGQALIMRFAVQELSRNIKGPETCELIGYLH